MFCGKRDAMEDVSSIRLAQCVIYDKIPRDFVSSHSKKKKLPE
jgi:hypothetical protein